MINKLTWHLGQKCRGDHRPRTQSQLLANMLHLSSDGNFIRSSAGRPRMLISLHTRYWAGPFPLHCWNPGQNWPTQFLIRNFFFTISDNQKNCITLLLIEISLKPYICKGAIRTHTKSCVYKLLCLSCFIFLYNIST